MQALFGERAWGPSVFVTGGEVENAMMCFQHFAEMASKTAVRGRAAHGHGGWRLMAVAPHPPHPADRRRGP